MKRRIFEESSLVLLPDRMNIFVICFVFKGFNKSEDIPMITQFGLFNFTSRTNSRPDQVDLF